MRKLVFRINTNLPANSTRSRNLEISTHTGGRLMIYDGRPEILPIQDAEHTPDDKLLHWYRSRYASFGLRIDMIHDKEVTATPVVEQPVESVKVEPVVQQVAENVLAEPVVNVAASIDKSEEQAVAELFGNVPGGTVVEAKPVGAGNEGMQVSSVTPKMSVPQNPAETMGYYEMIKFAQEKGIEIQGGKSKELYMKALTDWFNAQPKGEI